MIEAALIGAIVLAIVFLIFGKKLAKMRVFKASIFKQFTLFFGSPNRVTSTLFIGEEGEVGIEIMPLNVGFALQPEKQRAWRTINDLAVRIEGMEGRYLPVGERSYMPLDPYNRLPAETKIKVKKKSEMDEKKNVVLGELDSIARRERGKAERNLRDSLNKREAAAMFKSAITFGGLIIILVVLAKVIWK